ncbi:MAG: hypothetical protein M0P72_05435 [Metallibacterium scheffleri]|jgi:hypothetical protein|uniref:hypothetical protein n=1 Tax=Metallibacterium scheffleri TaxID=993689 RepID=UPI0026EEA754|nr:hypothetical protein [Metallibacterium scheffleri]MCK9366576.1 hypothetical protein [Metallibacterium scheffleri]
MRLPRWLAVFEEFEEQGLMDGGERDEAEVIEDEQVDAALGDGESGAETGAVAAAVGGIWKRAG